MPEVLAALDAFLQEHRRCGDLDGAGEGESVWMACECGADIVHSSCLPDTVDPRGPKGK